MSERIATTLSAGLLLALVALIAYQVYMLIWTKRTTGSIPRPVLVLRAINIAALTAGTGAILWVLLP